MSYNQKSVIVRTGITGGIDIFFGNGDFGRIPENGAQILVEYIVSDGLGGNLSALKANNTADAWNISTLGYMEDGTQIQLNNNFKISLTTDLIFGTQSEDVTLTQMLAPNTSRSFVLANETNYKYFLMKTGMFSSVEVIKGYASQDANKGARIQLDKAQRDYQVVFAKWQEAISQYGQASDEAQKLYDEVQQAISAVNVAEQKVEDTDMPDNTVFLMLIPDIRKRIPSSVNYFTCDESLFTLTEDEQSNLINLIEDSGQKIITMENRIMQPKIARFAVNASVKVWEGYDIYNVYSNCMQVLSNYFINFTRKDIIPLSDITALFENVEGVDSVRVWFDADVMN